MFITQETTNEDEKSHFFYILNLRTGHVLEKYQSSVIEDAEKVKLLIEGNSYMAIYQNSNNHKFEVLNFELFRKQVEKNFL